MIRRIVLFLGLLFVAFFAYRWYDRPAADTLLSKIKNLSFANTSTYTTTVSDLNGTGTDANGTGVIAPTEHTGSVIYMSYLSDLLAYAKYSSGDLVTTGTNKETILTGAEVLTGNTGVVLSTNEQLVQKILEDEATQRAIEKQNTVTSTSVVLPWIPGKVVIKTWSISTISAVQPVSTTIAKPVVSTTVTSSTAKGLTEEEKRQAQKIADMFSN